jgi:hypothetical protein
MDSTDLGFQTTITPRRVETHTTLGWVAAIEGFHDTHDFRRTFLARITPADRDTPPRGWNAWHIPGPGLYEYRRLGNCELHGFFVVEGAFHRKVRLITAEEARDRVSRMPTGPRRQ